MLIPLQRHTSDALAYIALAIINETLATRVLRFNEARAARKFHLLL